MKTDELLACLSKDVSVTRPSVRYRTLCWIWIFATLLFGGIATFLVLGEVLERRSWEVIFEATMLFVGGMIAGLVGVRFGFPDRAVSLPLDLPIVLISPFVVAISLILSVLYGVRVHPEALSLRGCACSVEMFAIAVIPACFLLLLVNRAAPLRAMVTAGSSALSAGLLGSGIMHIMCPVNDARHVILYHLLPVLVFVGLGFICCDWVIRFEANIRSRYQQR